VSAIPGRLVLLGHPVSHSLSPVMHNAALMSAGFDLEYEALDVLPERLTLTLAELRRENAAGNVTAPHKPAVFQAMNRLSPLAERVGAVNTFRVMKNGDFLGHNTDAEGFDELVLRTLGYMPQNARVAVIGAGGSAAAVLAALEKWKNVRVTICARRPEAANALAERFKGVARVEPMPLENTIGCDIVVNATTIGLNDDSFPIPFDAFPRTAAVLDLVYKPDETAWVRAARDEGMVASDGLPMLLEQGASSFELWFGRSPDRNVMWQALREATGRS
jgi:shikimate dehydrogenase